MLLADSSLAVAPATTRAAARPLAGPRNADFQKFEPEAQRIARFYARVYFPQPSFCQSDVEDAVSAVIVNVWRSWTQKIAKMAPAERVPFVRTIAKNTCISELDRKSRARHAIEALTEEHLPANSTTWPDATVRQDSLRTAILKRLKNASRLGLVLQLKLDGFEPKEIAKQLRVTEARVSQYKKLLKIAAMAAAACIAIFWGGRWLVGKLAITQTPDREMMMMDKPRDTDAFEDAVSPERRDKLERRGRRAPVGESAGLDSTCSSPVSETFLAPPPPPPSKAPPPAASEAEPKRALEREHSEWKHVHPELHTHPTPKSCVYHDDIFLRVEGSCPEPSGAHRGPKRSSEDVGSSEPPDVPDDLLPVGPKRAPPAEVPRQRRRASPMSDTETLLFLLKEICKGDERLEVCRKIK